MKKTLNRFHERIRDTAATKERDDLPTMRHYQKVRFGREIAAVICTLATISSLNAASAVATAIDLKTGRLAYAYWQGGPYTESQARNRAIQSCVSLGCPNPKVIASTPLRGYGAVVLFQTADKKVNYAVSLAAANQQQAINDALRKAKAAAGRYAVVTATWNDVSSKTSPSVIKL